MPQGTVFLGVNELGEGYSREKPNGEGRYFIYIPNYEGRHFNGEVHMSV